MSNDFMKNVTRDLPSTDFDKNPIYDLGKIGDVSLIEPVVKGSGLAKDKLLQTSGVSVPNASKIPVKISNPAPGNPYVHDKPASEKAKDSKSLQLSFLPNILDSTDTVTYHWKLFMLEPEAAREGNIWDNNNQVIIAESGVTEIAIDDVVIKGIATPTIETGTGTSTTVKFTLREPAGAGLLDKMLLQAIGLGAGNWTGMPYYLQLQFRGRNPDTTEPYKPDDTKTLGGLSWVWMIRISTMNIHVSTVGTTYECDAIMYNELAQTDLVSTIQHNVKLENLTNVASAMAELQDKLNFDQVIKLLGNHSIPDVFEIKVDPEIANEAVTPANSTTNSSRSNSMDTLDLKDATFNAGTGIDKIIDTVLSQTQKYQKSVINAKNPGEDGAPADTVKSQMRKFWRIITETKPIRFDPKRNSDAKHYTIYVVSYDIGVLESNILQTTEDNAVEIERKRFKRYANGGILRKKYNYIFTGLNDQVRNFDLTLNWAYAAATSRMSGVYSNLAVNTKGRVNHENAKKETELSSKVSAALAFQNNSKSKRNSRASKDAMASARAAIDSAKLDDETKKKYYDILDYSKRQDRTALTKELAGIDRRNNPGVNLNANLQSTFFSTPKRDLITQEQYRFLNDIDLGSDETIAKYREHISKIRPITFAEMPQDKQVGIGLESDPNSGIQKLSSMFSAALHSGIDQSLVKINLEIKGDPYWLFPQPFLGKSRPFYISNFATDDEKFKWIKQSHRSLNTNSVNYFGSDNFILVRFRTPRQDSTDGESKKVDPYTDVNLFSGVYKVIEVTSTFQDGVFKQELSCLLDQEINVLNFTKEIEEAVRAPDIPLDPEYLVDRNRLPVTSLAIPRIKSTEKVKGVAEKTKDKLSQGVTEVSNIPKNTELFRRMA